MFSFFKKSEEINTKALEAFIKLIAVFGILLFLVSWIQQYLILRTLEATSFFSWTSIQNDTPSFCSIIIWLIIGTIRSKNSSLKNYLIIDGIILISFVSLYLYSSLHQNSNTHHFTDSVYYVLGYWLGTTLRYITKYITKFKSEKYAPEIVLILIMTLVFLVTPFIPVAKERYTYSFLYSQENKTCLEITYKNDKFVFATGGLVFPISDKIIFKKQCDNN